MTAASVNVDFGECLECGTALKTHPDRGPRTKGKPCPNCEYGYLEGI